MCPAPGWVDIEITVASIRWVLVFSAYRLQFGLAPQHGLAQLM
ncbi:hypothetical protein J2W68_002478 [Luteimonas terrae]|uniref:IS6 family transposase n=1 Tax=Luteimonas terrae TaxID=1530191 RepID=A0ABU1XY86_9GAMM|nr:hypothetical protein [Luteimonas terrae]